MESNTVKKSPTKKTTTKVEQTQKTQSAPTKVALFAPNSIVHPSLGRLNKGYTIVDSDAANRWLQISDKVREATPQEVASAFEV
jgi:hypothetical protein